MPQPSGALSQWTGPRFIFDAVWDMVPEEPPAVHPLLVDADDAVTGITQELDHLVPAVRVVPVFCLRGALCRNANVWLFDRPAFVGKYQPRGLLSRIDT